MARRGSTKTRSVDHEEEIAKLYKGKRSASSGGADNDQGDVRSTYSLIECKTTGEPGKPKTSTLVRIFEKISKEASEESREPALAIRYYNPDSLLANIEGWVDLVIRTVGDDAWREEMVAHAET